jgi:sucrose-phosphate synthase
MITRELEDPLRRLEQAPQAEREVLEPVVEEIQRADLWGAVSCFDLAGQDAAAALYRWGVETRSVFCLPAEYEPFGLSLIEAMSVGLPVVATNRGGPQETTDGGRAGLLTDPDDYAQLASQVLRLITDAEMWQTYAERGREHVSHRYSWRRTAERYLALASEIVRGERGGDSSFTLPDFVLHPGSVELPRIQSWQFAGVMD